MTQPAQAIAVGRVSAVRNAGFRERTLLAGLRRRIAEIERRAPLLEEMRRLSRWNLGTPAVDRHLPAQSLALNAAHAILPASYADTPAAMGFALSLAIRRLDGEGRHLRPLLWCRLCHGNSEWGRLYGHGLRAFGVSHDHVLTVSLRRPSDLLWAVEEALRSKAFSAIIAEIRGRSLDLTSARRLSLTAETGLTPVLLVCSHSFVGATAAISRWQVKARASTPPPFDDRAPGAPAWDIALEGCRGGRPGDWSVEWSHATHRFSLVAPVSRGTAEPRLETRGAFAPERAGSGLRTG
jgi:protein ImuA